jgi:hypothetical protein
MTLVTTLTAGLAADGRLSRFPRYAGHAAMDSEGTEPLDLSSCEDAPAPGDVVMDLDGTAWLTRDLLRLA